MKVLFPIEMRQKVKQPQNADYHGEEARNQYLCTNLYNKTDHQTQILF